MGGQQTRREFLKNSAATTMILAEGPKSAVLAATKPSLFQVLRQFKFAGQDGNVMDLQKLERELGRKVATLTFGYNGCDQYCVWTNPALAEAGEKSGGTLKHIAINVIPETEGHTQGFRDGFLKFMTDTGMKAENIIPLYPLDESGQLSNVIAPLIAIKFGEIANLRNPRKHTDRIFLFDDQGRHVDDVAGVSDPAALVEKWGNYLNPAGRAK